MKMIADSEEIIQLFSKTISNIKVDKSFFNVVNEIVFCKNNNGKIITSGMGKAGIAMRKFSSILCSLGFPSVYLHPGEASHGDLGIIGEKDILFLASTSGKTREVLEVLSLSRDLYVSKIIGITSHLDSPLRKYCDIILDMGEIEEAKINSGFDFPPTSSIFAMLAITDTIAILSARKNGITKEDYSKYHHGGYLGEMARR